MTVDDFCSILSRDERWQAFLVNFGQCWESGLFADPHALGRLLRDWMDDCLRVYPNPEDFNSSAVRSMLIDRLNSGFRLWGRPIAGVEVRGLSRVMAVGDALWSTHRLFDLEALADAGLTEDDEFHEDFFDWLSDLRGRRSEALDIGASMRGQLRLFWATRADAIESMRAGLSLDRPSDSLAIAVVDGLGLEASSRMKAYLEMRLPPLRPDRAARPTAVEGATGRYFKVWSAIVADYGYTINLATACSAATGPCDGLPEAVVQEMLVSEDLDWEGLGIHPGGAVRPAYGMFLRLISPGGAMLQYIYCGEESVRQCLIPVSAGVV